MKMGTGLGSSVISRRSFLRQSAGAALGFGALTALQAQNVKGANDKVNVALIGCGGRGSYVMRTMIEEAGANCVCLCDLSDEKLNKMKAFIKESQPTSPRLEKDHFKVMAAKDVDAVVIATPDNWHAPLTIMACQAGKDVYVEKPHSHCIWESGQMLAAAKKYNRIVQVGTQNRSKPYNLQAREIIRSGKLGKIGLVKVFNLKDGGPFKLGEPGKQPDGFDWDRWLGRAPLRPYHQRLPRGGWHYFWEYCGGDMTDDGIHQIDLALMLMGDPGLPKSVRALGNRYIHKGDDAEVADVLNVSWDFGTFAMTFDMSQYPKYMVKSSDAIRRKSIVPAWMQNSTRIEIYGQNLFMILGRHGGGFVVEKENSEIVEKVLGTAGDYDHYQDFTASVKSRKMPHADITIAHASNVAAHMGNIAYRLGNLALNYDAASNTFDNPEATKQIKCSYRKGYEIPDQV
jgi:predicted dehydrogenase